MKRTYFLLLLAPLVLVGCLKQAAPADQKQPTNKDQTQVQDQTGLANPASVYCEQQGGRLEIRNDADGGQVGYCIFADGSECEEWSFFQGDCIPVSQQEDIGSNIKQLFIEKYNKNQDEVQITISQQTPDYARGGVKFGEGGVGEGGIFLAAKVDGKWELVFDGNGTIPCSQMDKYNIPESLGFDCFDY